MNSGFKERFMSTDNFTVLNQEFRITEENVFSDKTINRRPRLLHL